MTYRDASFDFKGSIGEVVNIKRPTRSMGSFDITPLIHNDFLRDDGGNISDPHRKTRADAAGRSDFVPDHIEETYIQVKLDTNRGSEHYISDEQLDFDVERFAAEILIPQTRGMAEYFEWRAARDMVAFWGPEAGRVPSVKATLGTYLTENAQAVRNAIIDARKTLNAMNAPSNGRFILATPEVEAILLKDPMFQGVDWSGTTDALRNATIGKLFGLNIVTSNELANHTADGLAMYVMHPTALILCTKAPAIPQGAAFGSGASAGGIALRWMMDYDPKKLQDRSFLNTYLGTTPVTEDARYITDMKTRLPKLVHGITVPDKFDIMRAVRIDLELKAAPAPAARKGR